jgi:hypothetical protein
MILCAALGTHLFVQCLANCLQQLIRLARFVARNDLGWTDSQVGTCDDLYEKITWSHLTGKKNCFFILIQGE